MTDDIAVKALAGRWRKIARAKRTRANELGGGRAGLEHFTEATTLTACADEAERELTGRPPHQAAIRLARPADAEHLPMPGHDAAMATAGVLFHFVGGSAELRERLAKWMQHHEGDLDERIIQWYLTACHEVLEPGCEMPLSWDPHHGRTR